MPFASSTTDVFRRPFAAAAPAVQSRIRTAYRLRAENPDHPSLRFKKVHDTLPICSVRVDLNWRAVGVMKGDTVIGFFAGPHADTSRLLSSLSSSNRSLSAMGSNPDPMLGLNRNRR